MALASSGPTQSVAVSLAAILATVAYAGFLPILICFIPMLGIALGYQRLNAWHTSAGATYSWVGRALNPHAGFLAGWLMLMYYTVGTTSLTVPLGTYFLSFFSDSAANNQYAVAAVGSAFDLIVLAVAARGAGVSAKFQWVWAVFEYACCSASASPRSSASTAAACTTPCTSPPTWFTIGGAGGFKALISGVLLAIFLYSGWDTAAYVTEEARGKQAGRAAVTSVILLFVIYAVAVLAFQGIAPNGDMQANAGNILAFVGDKIGGGFWKNVMIVAVLGGTLASLQAAIVSSARISFAMGRDRVIPSWFGAVSEKYRTPVERHHPARPAEHRLPLGVHADLHHRPGAERHPLHPRPDGGDLLPAHGRHRRLVLPAADHRPRPRTSSSAACCPASARRSWPSW